MSLDIVKFWSDQVDIWNEQEKCGFCWEFAAPLVPSQINIVQTEPTEEDCCIKVFLTDLRFRESIVRNTTTNLITNKTCVWTFSLWVMQSKNLGINNYNEIKGHSIEESKWNELFYPLINCLGCDNIMDTCEILGETNVNVAFNGDATLVHNYLDDNYNGWKINYTFTQTT